jgi:hypothetical protein
MRPFSFGHRWLKRRPPNAQPWHQNPWIGSSGNSLQSSNGNDAVESKQQKSAIGTWEDEGGSVGTDSGVRR